MSVQTNQYLIYGVHLPYSFVKEWEANNGEDSDFYDRYESFCDDSAFKKEVVHKDGIFCLMDGMNGKYLIIGRVLEKGTDDEPFIADGKPVTFPEFTDLEKELISNSIERNFGVKRELKYWLVTHYR